MDITSIILLIMFSVSGITAGYLCRTVHKDINNLLQKQEGQDENKC